MELLELSGLPERPSAAAAAFHCEWLGRIEARLKPLLFRGGLDHLIITFPAADYTHSAWRLAAIQALAREHAPLRVNATSGGSEAARAAAFAYLEAGAGITGQYLPLDEAGAGAVAETAA